MVFFCCNACGSSLKKAQVEKHSCRSGGRNFSCMDCHKDFRGDEYKVHTKCVSEEEKYAADGWKAPANRNKNEKKQMAWVETVQATVEKAGNTLDPSSRSLLQSITKHENVPRKRAKFINFIKNISGQKFNEQVVDKVWTLLENEFKSQNPPPPNPTTKTNPTPENKQVEDTTTTVEETDESNKKKKKKKDKKKKESESIIPMEEVLPPTDLPETMVEEETVEIKKKKKKDKKKRKSDLDLSTNEDDTVGAPENGDVEPVTVEETSEGKKKKKKDKKKRKSELEAETLAVEDVTTVLMENNQNMEIAETTGIKKKKDKKKRKSELTLFTATEETVEEIPERKKKKSAR